MLKMDGRDVQPHHSTEVKLKLAEIGAMTQRHHTRVVRTGTELREDDLALFGEEELHAPDAVACQGLRHLSSDVLCLLQRLVADGVGHPTLAIVAAFLNVADRRAEDRWPMFLGNSQQSELRLEVDELLDDHLLHIAATLFHGITESFFQLIVVVDIALSMT